MSLVSKISARFRAELLGQTVGVICSTILIVGLARLLPPDGYGLLFLSVSVFAAIQFLSKLGLARSAGRYIAKYKEKDPEQIHYILKYSVWANILSITIVCIIFILTYDFIADLIGEPQLAPFLLVGILFIAFGTTTHYLRVVFQGFEDIKASAFIYALNHCTRVLFSLGFVFFGFGAMGALVGFILAFIITTIVGSGYLYTFYYMNSGGGEADPDLLNNILNYAIPLSATTGAGILDKRVDVILVGFFLNPLSVAYYTIGKQVSSFVAMPVSSLGHTLAPTLESEKTVGNIDGAARLYEKALGYSLIIYIPAGAGIVILSEHIIEQIFGQGYLGAAPVLQLFGIYIVLQSITYLTSNSLDYLGRARERAIVKGFTSISNVVLNILLIPWIGVIGAALSTVITYTLYTIFNIYIINLEFDLRFVWLAKQIFFVIIITFIMSYIVQEFAESINGIPSLMGVVITGVIVWGVLSIALGLFQYKQIKTIVSPDK